MSEKNNVEECTFRFTQTSISEDERVYCHLKTNSKGPYDQMVCEMGKCPIYQYYVLLRGLSQQ